MQDAWRAYLELARGVTSASRRKAEEVVRDLRERGGATAVQAWSMVEERLAGGRADPEALTRLIRDELDRALGAVEVARADEMAALSRRVQELERRVQELAEPVESVESVNVAGQATSEGK